MTIRCIWICDWPGCDLREEVPSGAQPNMIKDHGIRMTGDWLWQGHLCRDCAKKAADKIRATFSSAA